MQKLKKLEILAAFIAIFAMGPHLALAQSDVASAQATQAGAFENEFDRVNKSQFKACPPMLKAWIEDDFADKNVLYQSFPSEAKSCQSSIASYKQILEKRILLLPHPKS